MPKYNIAMNEPNRENKHNSETTAPPKSIQCRSCNTTMVGFESTGSKPPDRDDCPFCGGTKFEFV